MSSGPASGRTGPAVPCVILECRARPPPESLNGRVGDPGLRRRRCSSNTEAMPRVPDDRDSRTGERRPHELHKAGLREWASALCAEKGSRCRTPVSNIHANCSHGAEIGPEEHLRPPSVLIRLGPLEKHPQCSARVSDRDIAPCEVHRCVECRGGRYGDLAHAEKTEKANGRGRPEHRFLVGSCCRVL